jgi:hypothetical protein
VRALGPAKECLTLLGGELYVSMSAALPLLYGAMAECRKLSTEGVGYTARALPRAA